MSALNKTRELKIILFILTTIILSACKPKSRSELCGTYLADYSIAREEITLNNDGTFIQKVTIKKTSKVDVIQGTWEYFKGDVLFNNLMTLTEADGKFNPDYMHPPKDEWDGGFPAYKIFGAYSFDRYTAVREARWGEYLKYCRIKSCTDKNGSQ